MKHLILIPLVFGISNTAEHFDEIAEAREAEAIRVQKEMEQKANGD